MGLDTSKKINRVTVNGTEMRVVGVPDLQDKLITENGTYKHDTGYEGFGTIEVDVQPPLLVKEFKENGTFKASDEGAYGYSEVTIKVAGGGSGEYENIYEIKLIDLVQNKINGTVMPTEQEYLEQEPQVNNLITILSGGAI